MPFGVSKGKGPSFFFALVIFFFQKISIALQRMQASSILSQAVIVGSATS
jgi:hypothetical protein